MLMPQKNFSSMIPVFDTVFIFLKGVGSIDGVAPLSVSISQSLLKMVAATSRGRDEY